jgi:hypothetical protein
MLLRENLSLFYFYFMGEIDFPAEAFILTSFFKPTKKDFDSRRFASSSAFGKPYTVYISHGNCLIEPNNEVNDAPEFEKTYIYPEDADTPDEIQQISEELIQNAEKINSVKLDEISLTWGMRNDGRPFLTDIGSAYFTPSNELQNSYSFQYMLFIALEIAKQTTPNVCITNSRSCVGGFLSIERKKIESHQIAKFVQRLGVANKKECHEYMVKKMSSLCPQMMMSMCPVCPNCFRKFSKMVSLPTPKQREKAPSRPLNTMSGTLGGATTSRSLRPSSHLTSRTLARETTKRNYVTMKDLKEANDIHALERYSKTIRRSGNQFLRPTQSYSFKTYKQAYKIYHNQAGFSFI